jgi:Mycolic acid cyclopropane synthetase
LKVFDFKSTIGKFYQLMYNDWYFFKANRSVPVGIRIYDAWPAVCYLHGLFDNIPVIFSVQEQINYLMQSRTRTPRNILEIGSGAGVVSCTLASMGYNVNSVEVVNSAVHLTKATSRDLFGKITGDNHSLYLCDLATLPDSALENIDTVLLIESIEHIKSNEWWSFYNRVVPHLKKNNGQLIITNEPEYWPLGFPGDCVEHISLIDDNFYDKLSDLASETLYRKTSHIVCSYS